MSLIEFMILASAGTLTAAGASHSYRRLRHPRSDRGRAPNHDRKEEGLDRPAAGAWHEPRQHSRHRLNARLEYLHGDQALVGELLDVSKQGWRVRGAQALTRGTILAVTAYLPGETLPLTIEAAVVRWTNGREFGLELTGMAPGAAARLSDYLTKHFPTMFREEQPDLSPFSYN